MNDEPIRLLISYYERVITSLKTQKARNDKLMDKYQDLVTREAEMPSNRFLEWTKMIDPYKESVVTGKATDYELLKIYEEYTKALSKAVAELEDSTEPLDLFKDQVDILVGKIIKLEEEITKLKTGVVVDGLQLPKELVDAVQPPPAPIIQVIKPEKNKVQGRPKGRPPGFSDREYTRKKLIQKGYIIKEEYDRLKKEGKTKAEISDIAQNTTMAEAANTNTEKSDDSEETS